MPLRRRPRAELESRRRTSKAEHHQLFATSSFSCYTLTAFLSLSGRHLVVDVRVAFDGLASVFRVLSTMAVYTAL